MTRSRSHSIDTDIRLYPRDSTSMTLSMYWSREIATLPRPNTLLLPLSANVMVFDEGLREDSMRRFLSPVIWFVHPLSMIHSVLPEERSSKGISISHDKLRSSISLKNSCILQDRSEEHTSE